MESSTAYFLESNNINLYIIQRELFGLGSQLFSLSYQTRLGFLFLLVLSVRQPTVITALSMLILSLIIDLDGLNGTLSNADWNDDFDAALLYC